MTTHKNALLAQKQWKLVQGLKKGPNEISSLSKAAQPQPLD